jgi:hypothetical protein
MLEHDQSKQLQGVVEMFKMFQRWWRIRYCLVVGHRPSDKILHFEVNASGEEYLEGRDCVCGKERFCVSMADHQQVMVFQTTESVPPTQIVIMTEEEAKGYHIRRLEGEGYRIVGLPSGARRRTPSRTVNRRIGQPARLT